MRSNRTTVWTRARRLGSATVLRPAASPPPRLAFCYHLLPWFPLPTPTQVPRASWGGGCDPLGMTPPPWPGKATWIFILHWDQQVMEPTLTVRVPAKAVVSGHPGQLCWECPCTAPWASRRELWDPWRQEGAAPQFSPLQHAGPGAGVMFSRRMNPFPRSACTQCSQSLDTPPCGSRGEAPPPHLVLRHCHCSLGNSPPRLSDSQGGLSVEMLIILSSPRSQSQGICIDTTNGTLCSYHAQRRAAGVTEPRTRLLLSVPFRCRVDQGTGL